ncbi:hypothetical protein DSUL_20573 [Desulfovibrionales bacterium]
MLHRRNCHIVLALFLQTCSIIQMLSVSVIGFYLSFYMLHRRLLLIGSARSMIDTDTGF